MGEPIEDIANLRHEMYVRKSIEIGLADSKAGRTTDVDEVRAKFELDSKSSSD